MRCKKCGSEKMGVMPNKKNPAATDLYCLECGAWQKFATRDEIRLYQTRKSVITNADRIRDMSDEELNELFHEIYNAGAEDSVAYEWGQRTNSFEWTMEWLQQSAGGGQA